MKTVCILGTAQTTRELAPFDDPSKDIWALGACRAWINGRRVSEWFEIHDLAVLAEDAREQVRWICTQAAGGKARVWLREPSADYPGEPFPADQIFERFGTDHASTISYLICFAIMRGYERIEIYGVDMLHESEYGHQRPNAFYWIGYARGQGIEVVIPGPSALAKSSRDTYTFSTPDPLISMLQERVEFFEKEIGTHRTQAKNHELAAEKYAGALEMARFALRQAGYA